MNYQSFENKVFKDYPVWSYVQPRTIFGIKWMAYGAIVNSEYCVGIWVLGKLVFYRTPDYTAPLTERSR